MLQKLDSLSTGTQLSATQQALFQNLMQGGGSDTVRIGTDSPFMNRADTTPSADISLPKGMRTTNRINITINTIGQLAARDYCIFSTIAGQIQGGFAANPANTVYSIGTGGADRLPLLRNEIIRGTYFFNLLKIKAIKADTGEAIPMPVEIMEYFTGDAQVTQRSEPIYLQDGESTFDQRENMLIVPLTGDKMRIDHKSDYRLKDVPIDVILEMTLFLVGHSQTL